MRMFQDLANDAKLFHVTASEDASLFTSSSLAQYQVIVLLQNIGDDIFTPYQLDALRTWVQNGGGIAAIHGAAAAMQGNEYYTKLIGASFDMHPDPQAGTIHPEKSSQIMKCCGGREGWKDEWYNFHTHLRKNKNLQISLRGDLKTFSGGRHGDDYPLVWCQEFEGGRVFFTALGHFDEAYEDSWFVGQVKRGMLWAAVRAEGSGEGIHKSKLSSTWLTSLQ